MLDTVRHTAGTRRLINAAVQACKIGSFVACELGQRNNCTSWKSLAHLVSEKELRQVRDEVVPNVKQNVHFFQHMWPQGGGYGVMKLK
jgi:hypothetical protein